MAGRHLSQPFGVFHSMNWKTASLLVRCWATMVSRTFLCEWSVHAQTGLLSSAAGV